MPAERTPQHERRAQTRAALLRAAGRVFAARGYHGATLQDVYRGAGVSRGALYHYFSSKRELFAALLADRLADAAAAAEFADLGDGADPIARFLERVGRDPRWLPLLLEFLALGARDAATGASVRTNFIRPAREIAAAATQHLLTDPEDAALSAEELAITTTALINGLAIERAFDPDGVPEDLGAKVFAVLAAGLRSATAADPST
ncbi:TetR/AcrR family transcriptional regulator [Mycolicibacillus parakoreensis]|uniref:TetR/AcrR family transcriptional regulator n=1 Tax=Mycolicibacillus parakoreensis TaxID=1069221 RepID=A0ABY3U2W2_9MYCO|nr:TetR/AcrR family transcriptional regulator [Mycolicibacillus parakoreensis]MCV7316215.1 TetR/AcrR family transcriptional regulator [Mycolicibacillus parakoreensis]ULN52466.1 TetR/AcrR family transcriptional regulator [Mycolicibacillus parakoreensis]